MTGSGTELDPYVVWDVDDLQAISSGSSGNIKYFILGGDIDASETVEWNEGAGFVPLSVSYIDFDGKGYAVSDLFINRPSTNYVGLGGSLSYSNIRNLNIIDADITGQRNTGVMVGFAYQTSFTDCHVSGYVTGRGTVTVDAAAHGGFAGYVWGGDISYCTAAVSVSSSQSVYSTAGVGGFVGKYLAASIHHCCATGNVSRVNGGRHVGGFAGITSALLYCCFATGDVSAPDTWGGVGGFCGGCSTGGDFSDCYSRGAVFGNSGTVGDRPTGGFVGQAYTAPIKNCYSTGAVVTTSTPTGGLVGAALYPEYCISSYWDIQTSGRSWSACGVGKTTLQMKAQSTFTGWDFIDIWRIGPERNDGYPCFLWYDYAIVLMGYIWVEGTNFAYLDCERQKRLQEGTLTGVTDKTPSFISVDGNYQYYVDSTGAVRRIEGTLTGLEGKLPSQISINTAQGGTKYCYIDADGKERCFEGTAV